MNWLFERGAEGKGYLRTGFTEAVSNLTAGKNTSRRLAAAFAAALVFGAAQGAGWGNVFYGAHDTPEWGTPQPVESIERNAMIGAGVFGAALLGAVSAGGLISARRRWRAENAFR